MEEKTEALFPKRGDIIRLPQGCGAVLDVYKNANGNLVLKVFFSQNVFRFEDPEEIPLDVAADLGMQLADEVDLFREIHNLMAGITRKSISV